MFNTGDQGFIRNGEIYVTGRTKDVIILRGENYLAIDFEEIARSCFTQDIPRVLAFGVLDPADGSDRLVLISEAPRHGRVSRDEIKNLIVRRAGVYAHVETVRRGAIPITTSGKLQRSLARRLYMEGKIELRSDD